MGQSVTVSANLKKQLTHTTERKRYPLVTRILADFAINLSAWQYVYSLNRVTILCIKVWKIDFLGKN